MQISLIAARSQNNVIGLNNEIPWRVEGEQLLFRALTFNHWVLVGRKTFESMGELPCRRFALLTRGSSVEETENVRIFSTLDSALQELSKVTAHLMVAGGGEVFRQLMPLAHWIHLSTIHADFEGDAFFPEVPGDFRRVYRQEFVSNVNYSYEIYGR